VEAKEETPGGIHENHRRHGRIEGKQLLLEHGNRNKRSVVLDLKSKKGMELFLKLIDTQMCFSTT